MLAKINTGKSLSQKVTQNLNSFGEVASGVYSYYFSLSGESLYLNCFWHIYFQNLLHMFANNYLGKHFCEQNQEDCKVNSR